MIFTIVVLSAPFSAQASYTAYRFTKAALESGHTIFRVFFYQDGVHASSSLATPPQDEFDSYKAWQALQQEYQLDFVTCIAAAARRGLINESEAHRHNKSNSNIAPNFELSGLGQLIEATVESDRVVSFGA